MTKNKNEKQNEKWKKNQIKIKLNNSLFKNQN